MGARPGCSPPRRATGATARVHLKVDTGLGRNGRLGRRPRAAAHERWPRRRQRARSRSWACLSHFAYADAPQHPTVKAQQERFEGILEQAARAGVRPQVRHLANSAATLTNPSAHYDLVRPGVAVYGLSPVPDLGAPEDFGLREAMRLRVEAVAASRSASRTGRLLRPRLHHAAGRPRLGLVPMGYSDGVPRHATNVGPVQVGGRRYAVAGRVCMDQFVLDLGPDTTVQAGDEVVLFGVGAAGEPTAQDWAAAIDTINYEIVTRVGARVPRIHLGGEQ